MPSSLGGQWFWWRTHEPGCTERPGEGAVSPQLRWSSEARGAAPARRDLRTASPQRLPPLRHAGIQAVAVAVQAAALNLDPLGLPEPGNTVTCRPHGQHVGATEFAMFQLLGGQGSAQPMPGVELWPISKAPL